MSHYDTLDNSVGYVTRMAFRAFARVMSTRLQAHGVTIGQWRFLRALWIEDGITQRELSARVGLREATATTTVRTLERDKLITRVRRPEDKRRYEIRLTAKAVRLKNDLMPLLAEVNAIAANGVSARDLAIMSSTLVRIRENLDRHAPRDAGIDEDILA